MYGTFQNDLINLYSVQSSFKIILGYAVVMVTKVLTFMRDGS